MRRAAASSPAAAPSRGARRAPAAPGRHDPRAAVHGRRRGLPADDAQLRGQGQPQGAPGGAPRGALASTPRAGSLAFVDGGGFAEPSTKAARALLEGWGQETPLLVVASEDEEALIKSFRNLDRVLVTVPAELEIADIVWARSLLVSEAALPLVQTRAGAKEETS